MKPIVTAGAFLGLCALAHAAPTASERFYYNAPDFADWGLLLETDPLLRLGPPVAAQDGGVLISGTSFSIDLANVDPYHIPDDWFVTSHLLRLDPGGALDWRETYHPAVHSFLGLEQAVPTATGTIATGSLRQPDLHYDLWVQLTDAEGQLTQEYNWGLGLAEATPPMEWMNFAVGTAILPTGVGTEYLVGGWYSVNAENARGFLFAFDASDGSETWRQGIQDTGASWLFDPVTHLERLPGGGYLLATKGGLHRLDAGGNATWGYGPTLYVRKAVPLAGGGFAALATGNRFILLDSSGGLVAERILTSLEKTIEVTDFVALPDGFLFTGAVGWQVYEDTDVLLLRTDAEGNERYCYPIGTRNDEAAERLCLTPSGDAVILEGTATLADGQSYPWILRVGTGHTRPVASARVGAPNFTPFVEEPVTLDGSASFDPDGAIVWYYWDFGDGTQADGPLLSAPVHSFERIGELTVTLRVRDNEGIESTTQFAVTILPWAEQWSRVLGTGAYRYLDYIVRTGEGFAVAGYVGSSPRITKFVRLDQRGVEIPGSVRGIYNPTPGKDLFPLDLQATPDGGFILPCVMVTGSIPGDYSLRLTKLNASGNTQWERTFDSGQWEYGIRVHALGDGSGYVVAGWRNILDPGATVPRRALWFLRTNGDGTTTLADRDDYFDPALYPSGTAAQTMIACADGSGYILGVYSTTQSPFEFLKVDAMGNELWRAAFSSHSDRNNLILDLAEAGPDRFLVAGESYHGSFVGQFRVEGTTVSNDWATNPLSETWWYEGADRVLPLSDGQVLVTNRAELASLVHRLELCKLRADGSLLWSHAYAQNGFDSETPGAALLLSQTELVMLSTYKRGSTSTKRIFKLAPNHCPIVDFELPAGAVFEGHSFRLDASACEDPDGLRGDLTYRWHIPGTGEVVTTDPISPPVSILASGTHQIGLTVVDGEGGETTIEKPLPVLADSPGLAVQFLTSGPGTLSGSTLQWIAPGGASAPVAALADGDALFAYWAGDMVRSDNPVTIGPVTRDLTLTAHFLEVDEGWFTGHGLVRSAADFQADSDGDGARNWEEYLAGTDPTDPSDRFVLDGTGLPGSTLVLTCPSEVGRTYTLVSASDLAATVWQVRGTQAGTGLPLTFDCSELTSVPHFFRIIVSMP